MKLSVIVITLNEEVDLESCLKSVQGVADEVIVVDSGSTDRTLDIARRFTDKIFSHSFQGYSHQKQFALEKAQAPWVLNIDADERLTPGLGLEIKNFLDNDSKYLKFNAFSIPFRTYFLGKRLRFGSPRGERHIRLYRRDKGRYGSSSVHEGIQIEGPTGTLNNSIDHYSYRTLEEYMQKCNHYTTLIAEKKFHEGRRFHLWDHFRWPYEFIVRYVMKMGFLDGEKGFSYAALSSTYVWLKYMKLRDYGDGSR